MSQTYTESQDETIARALEVFVHGFTFTRSFTHPYLAERVGPLWVMRDAPRKRGSYRVEEWVAHGVAPAEIDRIARVHTRGRFTVCAVCHETESDDPIRAGFKELGYRLHATEPLMVHSLAQIPHFDAPATIERVTTHEVADRLTKAARKRQILPEHLTPDAPLRQYVASINDELVGWVRSVTVKLSEGDATWCADMYVKADFRRRGTARALLSRMLLGDQETGAQQAVLLASHTGAKLYPLVGYEQIGTLFIYTPPRKQAT